jgi:tetratricopeptide (TPR) repeat protein
MKAKGNSAFKNKNFEEAVDFYTQAIELDQQDVSFYSNRAACYLNLKKYEEALQDGTKCVELNPKFAKGYVRKAMALKAMG